MGRAGGLGSRNPSQMLAKAQRISGKLTLQITISRFSEQKTPFQVEREAKRETQRNAPGMLPRKHLCMHVRMPLSVRVPKFADAFPGTLLHFPLLLG